ncbi:MAG: FGGY family carbohydrate kinase [Chloroflexota bacterium]|nr:FGGY family carbohydrate kinase [Chloroflexota bacterium]
MTLLLGLDVGTTNVKAAVYEPDGRAVSVAVALTKTHHPRPGVAHHLADELWDQALSAIRDAVAGVPAARRAEIAGVAVASVGEAGVPLDARGEPTAEVIAWYDTRSAPQADRLGATVGRDALFAVSGLSLQPIWSACKLLWLRDERPDAFARTVRWLMVADWVAYRLCGVQATDHSLASRTHAFNLRDRRWDESLLAEMGLPTRLFAPLATSGTALGPILPEVARLTGLAAGTVVAAGGHDHVCGALAAGVTEPDTMLNSLGTAEALFLPILAPITDSTFGQEGYTQGAHVVPDRYYAFGGQYTTGAAIDWLRSILGTDLPYGEMTRAAAAEPVGSNGVTFLPHLRMAAPPVDDPHPGGAFIGLSTDTTPGALTRALLEGLAFQSRESFERLLHHAGIMGVHDLLAIGGVARNDLLMGIKASVLDRRLTVVHIEEATTLGAAMLGGIAAGVYPDTSAAIAALDRPCTPVLPDPAAVPTYDALYGQVFRPLYAALLPVKRASRRVARSLVARAPGVGVPVGDPALVPAPAESEIVDQRSTAPGPANAAPGPASGGTGPGR